MASITFSIQIEVAERLELYRTATNLDRKTNNTLGSRTETIDDLLKKAGF